MVNTAAKILIVPLTSFRFPRSDWVLLVATRHDELLSKKKTQRNTNVKFGIAPKINPKIHYSRTELKNRDRMAQENTNLHAQ